MIQYLSDGLLNYYFHSGIEIACCGYASETNKPAEVYIPDKVDKYNVTLISGGAFKDEASLRKIRFTNSICHIAAGAFQNCQNLESISIEDIFYRWRALRFAKFAVRDCPNLKMISGCGRDVHLEMWSITECQSLNALQVKIASIEGQAIAHCPELHSLEFARSARLREGAFDELDVQQLFFDDNVVYPEYIETWLPSHAKIHCQPNSDLVDLAYLGYTIVTK